MQIIYSDKWGTHEFIKRFHLWKRQRKNVSIWYCNKLHNDTFNISDFKSKIISHIHVLAVTRESNLLRQ